MTRGAWGFAAVIVFGPLLSFAWLRDVSDPTDPTWLVVALASAFGYLLGWMWAEVFRDDDRLT